MQAEIGTAERWLRILRRLTCFDQEVAYRPTQRPKMTLNEAISRSRTNVRQTQSFFEIAIKRLISDAGSGTGNSYVFQCAVPRAGFPCLLPESAR